MTEQQALGQRLRAARENAELSQQDVATRLGVYQSTVAFMEKGRRDVSALELKDLAQLFGMTTDELLGTTTSPFPDHAAGPVAQGTYRKPRELVGG